MAEVDVFTRLATYRPTKERRSIEDFFTELIAHLLRQESAIREHFIQKLSGSTDAGRNPQDVRTQVPTDTRTLALAGLRLDLVICENHGEFSAIYNLSANQQ